MYCMEAELRNFQVTVFSLCGSGIAPFQSSQVTHYSVCGSGTLSLNIFLVRRRNFKPKNIPCVEAEMQYLKSHNSLCGSGTSSHIIICIWNLSGFLCNNPKCPGAQGRRPLCQSHLGCAVLNYAILAVAPTGIVLICSVLIKHNRIS